MPDSVAFDRARSLQATHLVDSDRMRVWARRTGQLASRDLPQHSISLHHPIPYHFSTHLQTDTPKRIHVAHSPPRPPLHLPPTLRLTRQRVAPPKKDGERRGGEFVRRAVFEDFGDAEVSGAGGGDEEVDL